MMNSEVGPGVVQLIAELCRGYRCGSRNDRAEGKGARRIGQRMMNSEVGPGVVQLIAELCRAIDAEVEKGKLHSAWGKEPGI
jgi:hypothetical protein